MSTVAELRAIVGDAGGDLTDEQLLRAHGHARIIASSLVRSLRDRLDPAGAAVRREQERLQRERELAPRRRKYAREKARAQARRTA